MFRGEKGRKKGEGKEQGKNEGRKREREIEKKKKETWVGEAIPLFSEFFFPQEIL